MTEYLYDKENPRSNLRGKPQGWESFYKGMPNHFERTEMITRRLLKDNDGDLAKVSLDLKKQNDDGYRWRSIKNMSRFFKNPIGFAFWRYLYQKKQNRALNPWYMFVYACVGSIVWQLSVASKSYGTMLNDYQYRIGAQRFHADTGSFIDERVIANVDTTTMKKKMSNFNTSFKNSHSDLLTTSSWCRDQNFRKYFETRKRHGIEPSTDYNNFYNKDKAKSYYEGLTELDNLYKEVKNIK